MSSSYAPSIKPAAVRQPSFGDRPQPTLPRRWSDGSPIVSLPASWGTCRSRLVSPRLQLFDIEDEDGILRTWLADGAGRLLGHRPDRLSDHASALLRQVVLAHGPLKLHGKDGTLLLKSDYMSAVVFDPLVQDGSGLLMRGADGRLDPIRTADGTPILRLNPGWSAPVMFAGSAPLHILDLQHVHGMRAFWYIDETGMFLGGAGTMLDEAMRRGIDAYAHIRAVRGQHRMSHDLTGYCRLNSLIRTELDPLLNVPAQPAAPGRGRRSDRSFDFALTPQATALTTIDRLTLQQDGCIDQLVSGGWFNHDGVCLASGKGASLSFELPWRPTVLRLSLALNTIGRFRLATVRLNGWDLATFQMDPNLSVADRRDIWVPAECLHGTQLRFELDFDQRDQGIACSLEAAVLDIGPKAPEIEIPDIQTLMSCFASLGFDCEFGFVQRLFGIEPLGLFRFAGYDYRSNLVRLIETDFDGLGSPGSLSATFRREQLIRPDGTVDEWEEFYMVDPVRKFRFHTWSGPKQSSEAEALVANERKLAYLARAMIEDLEDGEKIWVYKDASPVADHGEAFAVFHAINRKGPNKLFWVTRMVEGRPPGSVEWIAPNLLRGYSDQPHVDAKVFDMECWRTLCTNAYRAFAERAVT